MKILDIYIARKFLSTLAFILIATCFLIVIFDLTEKLDELMVPEATLKMIVFDYYLNYIPIIINLISPLLIFITVIFFTARMAGNTEILSILSSGVSYRRFIMPYLAVALLLCGLDLCMKNFIVPHAYETEIPFELRFIERGYNYRGVNIHRQLDKNTYFYAQNFDYNSGTAYRFSIEKFKGRYLVYKIQASDAVYDTTRKIWMIHNYVERHINGMKESIDKGSVKELKIPISRRDFEHKLKSMTAMSTPELSRFIDEESFKGESMLNNYRIEKYRRTALPFAIIVLVMMAVAISSRKIRGGTGMHIMIGILTAVSYELSMRFSTTLSTNSDLPPIVAVWLPNIFYGTIALILLLRAQK